MSCAFIMTSQPPTILDSDSVADAAGKLVAHRAAALPVVDAEGRYVGMFGIRDLLGLLVPRSALAGDLVPNLRFLGDDPDALRSKFQAAKGRTAGETADRRMAILHPDMPEIEALRACSREQATLAVVARDTGKLVGVMCCWDAIEALTAPAG
ncbi:MAG: CBS domain-containing protein [Rhizomicrobium sp.]|jgi:CBS-domain-containing membrane protein